MPSNFSPSLPVWKWGREEGAEKGGQECLDPLPPHPHRVVRPLTTQQEGHLQQPIFHPYPSHPGNQSLASLRAPRGHGRSPPEGPSVWCCQEGARAKPAAPGSGPLDTEPQGPQGIQLSSSRADGAAGGPRVPPRSPLPPQPESSSRPRDPTVGSKAWAHSRLAGRLPQSCHSPGPTQPSACPRITRASLRTSWPTWRRSWSSRGCGRRRRWGPCGRCRTRSSTWRRCSRGRAAAGRARRRGAGGLGVLQEVQEGAARTSGTCPGVRAPCPAVPGPSMAPWSPASSPWSPREGLGRWEVGPLTPRPSQALEVHRHTHTRARMRAHTHEHTRSSMTP